MSKFKILIIFIIALIFYKNPQAEAKNTDLIVINRKGASRQLTNMRPVIFPHVLHEKRDKCENCHPKIFAQKIGSNDINMQKNAEGKYCGFCHNGKIAWSLLYCDRCHSGDASTENPLYRKE